ncbi:MAG: ABC transporter ATP-binding protein [Planctomycetes bacterium]|nr:ABC transporter ATP-binding protein [Planctomycetota bacterium]
MSASSDKTQDATTPKDEYEGRGRFAQGLLPRLMALVWPHKLLLFAALLLFPLVAAAQLAQPQILRLALDGPVRDGDGPALLPFALAFLGLIAAHATLQLVQSLVMQLLGQRAMRDIRTRLFRRVVTLAPSYFDRTPQGKIMTRLTGDVAALNEFISSGLVSVVADTVLLLGIVVTLLWMDWRLALISFALVPLLIGGLAWLRGRLRQLYRAIRNRSTALNAYLNESVIGMVIVQAFLREDRNREEYGERNEGLFVEQLKGVRYASALSAGVRAAKILTIALLLWAAINHTSLGVETLSLGMVVAFVDYLDRFYGPIDQLSGRYTILQTALASAEKVFTLLDESEELADPEDPAEIAPLKSAFELKGVEFRYSTGEQVLHGIDFSVPQGQTVAIVGATGAGKSTIVKLLSRFYDPSAGAVLWDGRDIREFKKADLRKRIAYVPQETFLFSETLEENIVLDPNQVTPERARQAAESVRADEVAADLPGGYDQLLGERGHDLSAGERQLVSFARALAKDPDLLILDEATANIDGETEERIQAALETLLADRTAVVIAHRLSTIKKADRIVVLHKGRVAEEGTHEELLAQEGVYWKLYRLQSEEAV